MSEDAARFARDAPGVEAAQPLHTGQARHVYTARLTDGSDVRLVTVPPDADEEERTHATERFEDWETLGSHPSISTVHERSDTPRPWVAVTTAGTPLSEVAPLAVDEAKSVVADVAEAFRHGTAQVGYEITVEPTAIRVLEASEGADTGSSTVTGACLDWPTRQPENDSESPYSPPKSVNVYEQTVDDSEPEPADDNEETDDSAAVFRLGTLAYYAATGQPPVAESENGDAIEEQRWPSPSFVNSDVSASFDAVVETALDPSPGERYESPYEFKRALLFQRQSVGPGAQTTGHGQTAEDHVETATTAVNETDPEEQTTATETADDTEIAGFSRRSVLGALGAGAIGVAAGGTWLATTQLLGSGNDGFPMFRYDAANTGYAPDVTGPTDDVTEAWSFDTGREIRASPVVGDGIVLTGSGDENIYALDTADGTEYWSEHIDRPALVSAAIGDGIAYLAEGGRDQSDAVTARDLSDGTERWRQEEPDLQTGTPVLAEGRLYVPGNDGIYALDAADGVQEWLTDGISTTGLSAAVSDGSLYVGARTGTGTDTDMDWQAETHALVALDTSDGSDRWVFDTESFVSSSPAVVDGTVYVGTESDALLAVDADDGEERWRFETGDSAPSSPAVTDHSEGTVYIGSVDGNIYAVDTDEGEERWRFETDAPVISSPAVTADTLYVSSQDGYIYALATDNGEERWRFEIGERAISSPAVSSNTVFVGGHDGHLYALTEP